MPFISSLPIRETDNGFEDKRFYVSLIRELEKSFKPLSNNFRNTFREDIDKSIMLSYNFDEFLDKLKSLHYEIKMGKYIAARPSDSQNFIRFKSLGEFYSEQAIHNRFANKRIFESDLDKKIAEGEKKNSDITVLRVMRFYTISFKKGELSCRRIRKEKPFSWRNDEILDGLTRLNNKINEGATLESMRFNLAGSEKMLTRYCNFMVDVV